MSSRKPQAIVITPKEEIRDVISKIMPEWDFRKNVVDYSAFWGEAEKDNNIEVILIPSIFFTDIQNPEPYQEIVAQASSSCFVGILDYNAKNPGNAESIRRGIDQYAEQANLGSETEDYYFLDAARINVDLKKTVDDFINMNNPSSAMQMTIDILKGKESHKPEVADTDNNFYFESNADIERLDKEIAPKFDNEEPVLGKFIAVTSSKGGPGKSTVAISLATYLAQKSVQSVTQGLEKRPLKVLLLDMDVFDGQVGFLTNKTKPNIAHLYHDSVSKENIEKNVIHVDNLGINVLLASKNPVYQKKITVDFYKELCAYLQHMYDYIIFDTSVQYMEELMCQICYPRADKIVFVTESVITSILSMVRWIRFFTSSVNNTTNAMNIPKSKIGIVINKYLGNTSKYGDVNYDMNKIQQAAQGIETIGVIPSMPSLVASSANNSQMYRLVDDPGFSYSLKHIANYVVGDDYKLP